MKTISLESEQGDFAIETILGKHHLWLKINGAKTGTFIEISQRAALEIEKYIMQQGCKNGQEQNPIN